MKNLITKIQIMDNSNMNFSQKINSKNRVLKQQSRKHQNHEMFTHDKYQKPER